MPNWCSNNLVVEGSKKEVLRFKQFAQSGKEYAEFSWLEVNNFIPYPEEFAKLDKIALEWEKQLGAKDWSKRPKDGYNQGGYDWCIKNWGTKWGLCDVNIDTERSGIIAYSFDTAWSPPVPVIQKMGEMFPKLSFLLTYQEEGMGFTGMFVVENGKVITDECN